jgi:hypothetical protein
MTEKEGETMRQRSWKVMVLVVLSGTLLLTTRCGSTPESMVKETPVPPGVQVVNIAVKEDVVKELIQVKVFDQCAASSPFRPDVHFSQAESETSGEELVVKGQAGGEVGLSEVAKLQIGAEVEKKFASSRNVTYAYSEGGGIEVPPHTRQEYTLIWKEMRRTGTVEFVEEGVAKTADYEYRIGLELVRTIGKDLPCPTLETVPPPTIPPALLIPAGYVLYDDFEAANALEANWQWDDRQGICASEVRAGQLLFECKNDSSQEKGAYLHPSHPADKTTGVAAVVSLEKTGGPFQLVTKWQNLTDGSGWAYHLEATPEWVRAIKYDLKTNYDHPILLGEETVTPGVPHQLQIERTDDSILYLLDGRQFAAETAVHISPQLAMVHWKFDLVVKENGNSIKGQIDRVSIQDQEAGIPQTAHGTSPAVQVPRSCPEQHCIVVDLDGVQAQVAVLKRLGGAVLARALLGEL